MHNIKTRVSGFQSSLQDATIFSLRCRPPQSQLMQSTMKQIRVFAAVTTLLSLVVNTASSADWPQWRGPARDGRSAETGLLSEWPEDGPDVAWKVDTLGDGYSSLAIVDGRIYTMGNIDGKGHVICLSEKDGSTIWQVPSPSETKLYTHGKGDGARGTPTVDGDRVYVVGGGGDAACLRTSDGSTIWATHFVEEFGGRVPVWGYSESPLIDGDKVILTPGGSGGCVAALNKMTGDVIWRSEAVQDKAHYCSALAVDSHGVRQVITFTGGIGSKRDPVRAPRAIGLDVESGDLLWSYENSANPTANVSTPIFANDSVFTASAYGTGGGLAKLTKDDDGFTAEEVYFERAMQNHHGGIVMVDGHMYGFGSGGLICMNFETGEITWRNRSVQKGSLTFADGHLYCYGEKNKVALVEAHPSEYIEKGRFEVEKGDYPTWAHPVVANGKLYLRDMNKLTCYDVAD